MTIIEVACLAPWQDRSAELNELIRSAPEHCRIKLAPGEYYLRSTLKITGKKALILDAADCTFTVFCDPSQDEWSGVNFTGFEITGCENLTLSGFTCRQEFPANSGGEILDVQPDHVDVRFFRPLPPGALFNTGMAFSPEGRPRGIWWLCAPGEPGRRAVIAGEIATTAVAPEDVPHEALGNNCYRIFKTKPDRLRPGMFCNVKHWNYGPPAFVFRDSTGVTMDSVTITNWGGFGVAVLPRCRDFTFRKFACRVVDRQNQPYSCIVDGIHTTGLGGRLLLEDCFFDGLGDDTLNSHTQALRVRSADGARLRLFFDKPNALFPKRWGRAGDELLVYDGETLGEKARIRVVEAAGDGEEVELESTDAGIAAAGDYVVNLSFVPEVTIRRCTALNSRSRFCIQAARRLEIADCRFDMTGFTAPVYLSSALRYWGEGGLIEDIDIYDNEIRMPFDPEATPWSAPAIWVRVNDSLTQNDPGREPPKTRYRNLRIRNNIIAGRIEIAHCDGVEISGNRFDRPPEETIRISGNCTGVRIDQA